MLQPAQNQSTAQKYPAPATNYTPVKTVNPPIEQATIGRSLVIKGEITGSESLYIDGCVEGTIQLADNRVTVGRNGSVTANINAREVVIMGTVKGNIECTDRLDIRSEGSLTGDVISQRISVEDGAVLKGSVEVRTSSQAKNEKPSQPKPAEPAKPAITEQSKAVAAAAGASAGTATLSPGSRVVYEASN
ncbi:MAG: polymer-forming cytoskeletal protein [Terriglobales bacterium]